MNRFSTVVALALVSALATPVVVGAAGLAPKASPSGESSAPLKVAAQPAAAADVPCTRRVKVVYPAGAGLTACAAPALAER